MQKTKNNDMKFIAVTALKLLVICAFIAVLVSTVNFITKDKIALNQKLATADALSEIYENDSLVFSVAESGYEVKDASGNIIGSCEAVGGLVLKDNIDTVYTIYTGTSEEKDIFGYCVQASPMCFKDEVGILVAITPDAAIKDVKIISLKETKGIGDKVTQDSFLDKFTGFSAGFSNDNAVLKNIVISGATRTSEPVTKAIDTALVQVEELIYGGGTK